MGEKEVIKSTLIFVFATFIGFFLINLVIWFKFSSLNELILRSIYVTIALIIPLAIAVYYGKKSLYVNPKKVFRKMLFTTSLIVVSIAIIVSIVIIIASINCVGEECMAVILLFPIWGWVLLCILLSQILASIIYINQKTTIVNKLIIGLFVILLITLVFLFFKTSGCTSADTDCLIKKAVNEKDSSICNKAIVNQIMPCYFVYASNMEDENLCNFDPPQKVKEYYGLTFEQEYNLQKDECIGRISEQS